MVRKVYFKPNFCNITSSSGVYYCYNSEGELLYIGLSNNVNRRIKQHERENRKKLKYFNYLEREIFPILGTPEFIVRLNKNSNIKIAVQELNVDNIDLFFHRVSLIEIEEMDEFAIYSRERFAIFWFKPSLNKETRREVILCDRFLDQLDRVRRDILHAWEDDIQRREIEVFGNSFKQNNLT